MIVCFVSLWLAACYTCCRRCWSTCLFAFNYNTNTRDEARFRPTKRRTKMNEPDGLSDTKPMFMQIFCDTRFAILDRRKLNLNQHKATRRTCRRAKRSFSRLVSSLIFRLHKPNLALARPFAAAARPPRSTIGALRYGPSI